MPTPKIRKILHDFKAVREAMDALRNEPDYTIINRKKVERKENEFYGDNSQPQKEQPVEVIEVLDHETTVDIDRQALRDYVTNVLLDVSVLYFKQHEQDLKSGNRAFLDRDRNKILKIFADTNVSSEEITGSLLSNNMVKFTDAFVDVVLNGDNFADLVTLYADELLGDESDMETVFNGIGSVLGCVSDDVVKCANAGINIYEVIPDYLGPLEKNAIEDEFQDVNLDIPNERDRDKYNTLIERQQELTKKILAHADAADDAVFCGKEIGKLLEGVDPENREQLCDRLAEITAVVANDTSNSILSEKYGLRNDYTRSARFVLELMKKEAGVPNKFASAAHDIAFGNIAEASKAKFHGKISQNRIDGYLDAYNKRAARITADAEQIRDRFPDDLSAADVLKHYETLLDNVLDGSVVLSGLSGQKIERSPKCVAEVSKYIDRLLSEEKFFRLDTDDLTPAAIRNVCNNKVESEPAFKEYLSRFHSQLGKRSLTKEEYVAMMSEDAVDMLNTEAAVKYVGITKFVDKNSELLNDAIATYAKAEQFHNDHSFFYRFIHPFKYYDEYKALGQMKDVFTKQLKMTDSELSARKADAAGRSVDRINLRYMEKSDKSAYNAFVDEYENRRQERLDLVDGKLENVRERGNALTDPIPTETQVSEPEDTKEAVPGLTDYLYGDDLSKGLDNSGRKSAVETQKLKLDQDNPVEQINPLENSK